jgi:hypothetical protein
VYRHIRKDVYKYIEKNVVDCVCVAVGFGPEVGIYMVIRAKRQKCGDANRFLSVKIWCSGRENTNHLKGTTIDRSN